MAGVLRNYDPGPAGMTLCILVHSRAITVVGSNGGIMSVVMHTLDRYWRIVYPIHHRKHFRRWMLYFGLVVPWLIPLALHLLPTVIISKVDRGKCYRLQSGHLKTSGRYVYYNMQHFSCIKRLILESYLFVAACVVLFC